MSEDSGISKFLTDSMVWILEQIANGQGPKIMGYILLGVTAGLWLYCGIKIYVDAKERFHSNLSTKFIFLVFGLITGPLGLLLYSYTKPKYTPEELEFIRVEHKFYYFQAAKVLDCIKCNAYVLEGQLHCTNCGTQNRFRCEKCNKLVDYDVKFCPSCGVSLRELLAEKRSEIRNANRTKVALDPVIEKSENLPSLQGIVASAKPKAEKAISNLTIMSKSVASKINSQIGKRRPSTKKEKEKKDES